MSQIRRPAQYAEVIVDDAIGVSHIAQGKIRLGSNSENHFVMSSGFGESADEVAALIGPQNRIGRSQGVDQVSYSGMRQVFHCPDSDLRTQPWVVIDCFVEGRPAHESERL